MEDLPAMESGREEESAETIHATFSCNQVCCDCGQKSAFHANMTVGSFVCLKCASVLRGLRKRY